MAKIGYLDTPKFVNESGNVGVNGKVKNTRRKIELLRKKTKVQTLKP